MEVLGHLKLVIDYILATRVQGQLQYQGGPQDQDSYADWVADSAIASARSNTQAITLTNSSHYLHGHTSDDEDTDSERRNPRSVRQRSEVRSDLSMQGRLDVQSERRPSHHRRSRDLDDEDVQVF